MEDKLYQDFLKQYKSLSPEEINQRIEQEMQNIIESSTACTGERTSIKDEVTQRAIRHQAELQVIDQEYKKQSAAWGKYAKKHNIKYDCTGLESGRVGYYIKQEQE